MDKASWEHGHTKEDGQSRRQPGGEQAAEDAKGSSEEGGTHGVKGHQGSSQGPVVACFLGDLSKHTSTAQWEQGSDCMKLGRD